MATSRDKKSIVNEFLRGIASRGGRKNTKAQNEARAKNAMKARRVLAMKKKKK